ncbi:cobyrinate a,c-diamide synthase [Synechocystis sp. LKSZ1]|uniref:cobyrinate a,c-diamide synthase n=1 Tax=Synechocystis sp. LKSZ1 TaxID=3144951 RepID=UPI00336BD8DF
MAVIIAGERSGVGKTTVTLAILAYLAQKKAKIQSFKVGPDYIDPMFHTQATGQPCRNLDPILTSETYVQHCFYHHSQGSEFVLVEGVMGLFDGIPWQGLGDYASTAHLARLLQLPVILVIDCSRLSGSVAAIVAGYRHLDPQITLAGVILNRVGSSRHLTLLKQALLPYDVPILGTIFRKDDITLVSRHLGLIPTDELPALTHYFDRLAQLAKESFDWNKLLPLLRPPQYSIATINPLPDKAIFPQRPRIALARDSAFNFYYQDNLDLFQTMGAELIPFSPLQDSHLPSGIQGIYLGGGFPEIFAAALSANISLRQHLKCLIQQGLPTYAECGGLMYLCQGLVDLEQKHHALVGVLPTTAQMTSRLSLGYRQAKVKVQAPTSWLAPGETIYGHEFHRSVISTPDSPLFELRGLLPQDPPHREGWHSPSLQASYLHVHFGNQPALLQKFLNHALRFPTPCATL